MLYILGENPEEAAKALADADLIDALPLVASLLCGAHVLLDGLPEAKRNVPPLRYHPSEPFSPLTVWASQSEWNYSWCRTWFENLINMSSLRGLVDQEFLNPFLELQELLIWAPTAIEEGPLTTPPLFVPPAFRRQSRVESYRDYYFKTAVNPKWSAPHSTPQWFADRFALLIRSDVR